MTPLVVVMGVAATGKTSVAEGVSRRLGYAFIEGDSLHPPENIAKMASGVPLDDADRWPWLRAVAARLAEQDRAGSATVATCSALRRAYRDVLRSAVGAGPFFVQLAAPLSVLEPRMRARTGHFMPAALLRSQLDVLEPLEPDEDGVIVDVTPPLVEVVECATRAVRARFGV